MPTSRSRREVLAWSASRERSRTPRAFIVFPGLPPGTYDVSAAHPGFRPATVRGIELTLGGILKAHLSLRLAGVTEDVEVIAEPPLIDVKQSASSTSIRGVWIDKLPKGRDYTSLVTQVLGVNEEPHLTGISIEGASAAENLYIIDGIETGDLYIGIPAKELLTDFVDEAQVKRSGHNAEFGGATGGVINVVTKSGGSRYRGEGGSYFVSEELSGSARPVIELDENNEVEYVRFPKDDSARWEPGFVLGGPCLADRVWFLASYWPRLESTSRTVTFPRNGETRTFERDSKSLFDQQAHRSDWFEAERSACGQSQSSKRARRPSFPRREPGSELRLRRVELPSVEPLHIWTYRLPGFTEPDLLRPRWLLPK